MSSDKNDTRARRKQRIRKKVVGTTDRPRLSVFRSARHIYAQVVDDSAGATLASASTLTATVRGSVADLTKTDAARQVGAEVARVCAERGIVKVVFDRNGYIYHGRIRALAEAARAAGLSF
jgi:large subunit ribosomal protein L18